MVKCLSIAFIFLRVHSPHNHIKVVPQLDSQSKTSGNLIYLLTKDLRKIKEAYVFKMDSD